MIWILWFLQHFGQTHPPRGLQCQSGHRPPNLRRSDWIWRCREVQWTPPFMEVCRAWITDHQHSLPSTNSQKDIMDAPSLQTLASHWLCHSAKEGRTRCQSDNDYVWCRLLDRLVVSKLNLRIQPVRRPQGKKVPKKLDVAKLKQDSKRQAFVNDLCSRLDALEHSSEDVDESWTIFRDTVHSSAMDSLGPVSRKHQDWFDENDKEIQGLLEEKHQKHKAYLRNTSSVSSKTAYSNICKTVQTRLRDMQDSWLSQKADEIQSFADRKDMFFDAQDNIWSPELRIHPTP